ncbi:MAG TPA: NADH-quinone oxidoreductase subunit L [Fimbriiglobus sp.]|nr:NADH-quinone oxidoreductase subunit L [Fimbriiglobus sp.]
MSSLGPVEFALIALALPLAAAVLMALLSATPLWRFAHLPAIVSFASAAVLAIIALVQVAGTEGEPSFRSIPVTWFSAGNFAARFVIHVDPLSAVMLATVTFVATWIAVFSAGYMRDEHGHPDPGYARYFGLMSLFVFSMSLLVLANNFMLLIAGWEGVGVCSYLLVGYYYAKPSAAAAARKAFLVTRLGDVGMILGVFYLWQVGGYHTNLTSLFEHIAARPETHPHMTAACLLLFCGAVGKSAQLPLYVWLPDAMEGPTPVSALIHAATMVTAGVYLLARCAPLFVLSPTAQLVVTLVGGLTALLAAFIAIAQTDLKRVLAYSTVSQLGFMFMALGCGGPVAPNVAVAAAIFHLFTHAFFKALLFLGSGSVMHAMGNVIDMRRFGGLRKLMPVTHLTFLCGAAALAGLPLLSGFWSKDAILDSLYMAAEAGRPNAGLYWFVLVVALLTALLTAFYTFRAYFLTFWGEERTPPEAGHHAHESPWIMLGPLVVLAVGAVFAGIAVEPFNHAFSGFLSRSPTVQLANRLTEHAVEVPHFNLMIAALGTLAALAGLGLAWWAYRDGKETVPATLAGVYRLSREKLYVDEVYDATVVKPAETLATAGRQFDYFLDSLARLVSFLPRFLGALLRPLQNGLVQFYALGMVLGLAVFLTVIVFRSVR